jgi:hypothetical protein
MSGVLLKRGERPAFSLGGGKFDVPFAAGSAANNGEARPRQMHAAAELARIEPIMRFVSLIWFLA